MLENYLEKLPQEIYDQIFELVDSLEDRASLFNVRQTSSIKQFFTKATFEQEKTRRFFKQLVEKSILSEIPKDIFNDIFYEFLDSETIYKCMYKSLHDGGHRLPVNYNPTLSYLDLCGMQIGLGECLRDEPTPFETFEFWDYAYKCLNGDFGEKNREALGNRLTTLCKSNGMFMRALIECNMYFLGFDYSIIYLDIDRSKHDDIILFMLTYTDIKWIKSVYFNRKVTLSMMNFFKEQSQKDEHVDKFYKYLIRTEDPDDDTDYSTFEKFGRSAKMKRLEELSIRWLSNASVKALFLLMLEHMEEGLNPEIKRARLAKYEKDHLINPMFDVLHLSGDITTENPIKLLCQFYKEFMTDESDEGKEQFRKISLLFEILRLTEFSKDEFLKIENKIETLEKEDKRLNSLLEDKRLHDAYLYDQTLEKVCKKWGMIRSKYDQYILEKGKTIFE